MSQCVPKNNNKRVRKRKGVSREVVRKVGGSGIIAAKGEEFRRERLGMGDTLVTGR
jgi:hypothetical protein